MVEQESKGNPFKYENPKAQYFSDLWWKQKETLSMPQKDNIGRAYLEHILGVDGLTIKEFENSRGNAYHAIGMKQAGVHERKQDYESFWKRIAEITQEYSQEDVTWLAENSRDDVIFLFIFMLERTRPSYLLSEIGTNAHTYK